MNNTTDRDFAAEYLAARIDARSPDSTIADIAAAQRKAARIAKAAEKAGVRIDEIGLDEQARVTLYGDDRPRG